MTQYDYLVVGAGFAGCVLAERLASQLNKRILLVDRRPHIGGNAYDLHDSHGILIHQYGPHVFHTNDERVYRYLSQFTEWRRYEHRVISSIGGMLVPIPINRKTVNAIFGSNLQADEEVQRFFEDEREHRALIATSEDYVVSRVGRRLYEMLYKGYTRKQWGLDPTELAPSVCGRLPLRTNLDERYFEDRFQVMPQDGFTPMFERMVLRDGIDLLLGTGYRSVQDVRFDRLIFTGPIDEFFDYAYGKLPYRSLRFEFETLKKEYSQPVGVINYPNEYAYTRTTEYKHITGQLHPFTTISKEFPAEEGEPYYPIPRPENADRYELYKKEAAKVSSVTFVGRLAKYKYYNMDQVVAQSLSVFERLARGN